MSRLLIHIGYPKAASTTLQNAVFLGLHELGLINFLGRAFESGYCGFAKNKKEFKKWLNYVSPNEKKAHRYDSADIDSLANIFSLVSSQKTNILSEGAFILNDRNGDQFITPQNIYDYFHEKFDHIDIMLIIRSQTTLIMSNYIQRYRNIEEKKFKKYLNVHMNGHKKDSGDFKIYNIYNLTKKYAEVFGKDNLNIVLYEDMVRDNEKFVFELAKIIRVDDRQIHKCLGNSQFNVTKIDSDYHICKKPFKRSFRYRLGKMLKKLRLEPGELMKTKVPKMTGDEEQKIFDYFKDSNLKLAEEFSLNSDKMKRYKYV